MLKDFRDDGVQYLELRTIPRPTADLSKEQYVQTVLDVIEPPRPKVADGQIPPDDPVVATYRRRLSSVVLS